MLPIESSPMRLSRLLTGAGHILVFVLGLRLCYLLVRYVSGSGNVQRFHVESAAFLLVVIGVCFRLWRDRRYVVSISTSQPTSFWFLLLSFALSFGLYWPALFIGFLSDDFLLIERASAWRVGAVTRELFRPLPLTVWALILEAGAGAKTIHALNIALHAINAWLTTQIAWEWVKDKWAALSAGLMMLVMPLAPEAVAWSAGVFDVMGTTLILATILIARRYVNGASYRLRVSFIVIGLLAILTKETAAVVPILVVVDGWVRKKFSKPLVLDTAVLLFVLGIVAVIRLAIRYGITAPPLALRFVRRALFRSFGGLAFPWHTDLLEAWPSLPLVTALTISALVIVFVLHAGEERLTRAALACSAWVLVSILPVFNVLFISDDLQSARYLYLSSVGWSVLLVTLLWDVPSNHSWSHLMKVFLVILLTSVSAVGTKIHLTPWVDAAALRNTVAQEAIRVQRTSLCETMIVSDLPDNVRGAYVFRVGASEELSRTTRVPVAIGNESRPCSFRWNQERSSFISGTK